MHLHRFISPQGRTLAVSTIAFLAAVFDASANHGPGTSGGGLTTISGETLKASSFDLAFRLDFTSFDGVSDTQAEQNALASGGFDSIDSSVLASLSVSYGFTDDLQVSVSTGWYWGNNFIDAEVVDGTPESSSADPSGLTDLWITAKHRVMKGEYGHLSILGGVKAPTGVDDETLSTGELLEPSSQPGSGAWDFMAGVAYSKFLTSHITLDTSATYIFRTEANDFKVGDRFDAGVAVAWRLTDAIDSFPNISVFGEVAYTWIGEDESGGVNNPNSGGSTLYLAPGLRARLSTSTSFSVSPQFPVWQELNGAQVKTDLKVTALLGFTF